MKYKTALIVGSGAFGTAIASVLANNFKKVIIKARSRDVYLDIKNNSENSVYLPSHKLPKNITSVLTWDELDTIELSEGIDLIVSGLPTAGIAEFFKDNYDRFLNYFIKGIPLVSLSKGIDPETLELSDDLFYEYYPNFKENFTFLSGPSFAHEILGGHITLATLAGRNKRTLDKISKMLDAPYFKVLVSYDVKGVLLGGALKNILAIAGGIIEGLGHNHNTRAAMITRGIAEMLRFGKVYNARAETFYGLSGMGDLILTTTGDLSRNKLFGLEIAKGRKAQDIINSQRSVVEGYKTTRAAYLISEKYEIRTHIFNGVYEVLYKDKQCDDVIRSLMRMPTTFEWD